MNMLRLSYEWVKMEFIIRRRGTILEDIDFPPFNINEKSVRATTNSLLATAKPA
jgi:hypothetical protein